MTQSYSLSIWTDDSTRPWCWRSQYYELKTLNGIKSCLPSWTQGCDMFSLYTARWRSAVLHSVFTKETFSWLLLFLVRGWISGISCTLTNWKWPYRVRRQHSHVDRRVLWSGNESWLPSQDWNWRSTVALPWPELAAHSSSQCPVLEKQSCSFWLSFLSFFKYNPLSRVTWQR